MMRICYGVDYKHRKLITVIRKTRLLHLQRILQMDILWGRRWRFHFFLLMYTDNHKGSSNMLSIKAQSRNIRLNQLWGWLHFTLSLSCCTCLWRVSCISMRLASPSGTIWELWQLAPNWGTVIGSWWLNRCCSCQTPWEKSTISKH